MSLEIKDVPIDEKWFRGGWGPAAHLLMNYNMDMKVSLIAHPNSRKPRIETDLFGSLHVYVAAPPLEGRANMAVIEALAHHFQVKKSGVLLVKGERSKIKVFEVATS